MNVPAQVLKQMGRERFKQMVMGGQKGETMAEKDRGIKGRVRFSMCEHGNWVINDYQPQECNKCFKEIQTKFKDFQPHYNIGLGQWIDSKSQMMKLAKQKNLIHIGDDKI